MDTVKKAAAEEILPSPAPSASPSDELTDEDLEVVVGGLGRPWIALRALAE